MALYSPFNGQTLAWLLAKRTAIIEEMASGSQLFSAGSADVTSQFSIQTSPGPRLDWVNVALFNLDPDTYPLSVRPTRTTATIGIVTQQASLT